MTAAVLQATKGRTASATSISSSAITTSAGSVLAACAVCDTGTFSGTPPISDNKGNSWTQIDVEISNFGTTGGSQRMRLYFSELTTVGAGHTVTSSYSAAVPSTLLVVEIGGLASGSFDKSNKGNVHAAAPGPFATAATPATTQLIELVLGAMFGISGANPASHAVSGATPSAGWTVHSGAEETDGTQFYTGCMGSVRVTNTGTYVASFTETGDTDAGVYVATFKESGASVSPQPPKPRTIKTDRTLTPGDGGHRTFSPRRSMSGTRIQEAFSSATIANSTLSAPGDSTASFVGASQANSTLSAPGSATATFVGASTAASVLAAAGDSTTTFVGASLAKSVLAATADSTATFVGADKANSVLSAAADSTATFTGSSKAATVLSAPGDATASFTGASQAASTLSATGDSTASFIGRSNAAAVWNAAADASCSWIGTSGGNALSAPGDSTAIFVGAALAAAVLAAVADSSASFIAGLGDAEVAKTYYGHGGKRLKDDREEVEKRWELAELRKKNQAEKAALVKISKTAVDADGPKLAIRPSVAAVEAAQAEADVVLEEHEILSLLALALIADSA